MVKTRSIPNKIADYVLLTLLALAAMLCIAPIINNVAISFSDKAAAAAGNVYFWPVKFSWASYTTIIQDSQFMKSFLISLERVALGGAINFLLTVLMAYPLSKEKRDFGQRNAFMWIVVFTMLFSGGLIPWYIVIYNLHIMNTIWALVLPGAVPVFNVILLVNFFRSVPRELEEAGVMDGANPWYVLLKIYLPISVPALATVTLFTLVAHWNAFFDGMILINDPSKYPLQTYIQQMVVQTSNFSLLSPDDVQRVNAISNKTMNAAKIVVSMVPILVVYPFMQRYFVHGIVLGSVKG
ncbi:carbohydrate ABC transporter permease [Paenibacillus silvisoli]|uniref:carbohydrate ABC transporter permease n=1 Tax=Paenibacillus silvisoli TaxID=3110539 RepID=UPI0028059E5A|nr:carbohydrate ABC transporter permease [Paenibacillus silvisoli]